MSLTRYKCFRACPKNGSRRGNESDGCACLPGNPPRYLGSYGTWVFFRRAPRVIAIIGIGQLLALQLLGQTTNHNATSEVIVSNAVPVPDLPPNPVELFRQLLEKDRQEQEKLLTNRAPENRKQILAKVREYRALNTNQCELKLKATELRWHLRRLMAVPATNRPPLLALVPASDRKLVEARLRLWDRLPEGAKRQLQTNEAAITYFTIPAEQKTNYLATISPERRKKLLNGIAELNAMAPAQRQKLLDQFNLFFEFRPDERQKILSPLSETERQQIENTLKKFEGLPPDQREACIQSFEKFTRMSVEERQQFLKNAERWKLMTPDERQKWKDLVEDLSSLPPLPQDSDLPPLPTQDFPR